LVETSPEGGVLEERGSCQMFVCLCTGVTSEVIEDLVADGAVNTKEIARACGAGMECGRCRRTVRAIIAGNGVQ
jgi:bacterioferritin-associated ferredoxin